MNASSEEPIPHEGPPKRLFWNVAAVIGCMLIFALIVIITVVETAPPEPDIDAETIRQERYSAVSSKSAGRSTTYEWVDKQNGVVRIPVERALQLTAQRYNQ